MNSNHQSAREVAIDRFADELTSTLLGLGRSARDGAGASVAQLRKDVQRGRAKPIAAVLRIVVDALEHRAATPDEVALFAQQFFAICETLAEPDPAPLVTTLEAIDAAVCDETDAEGPFNSIEQQLRGNKSPGMVRTALDRALAYRRHLDRLIALLQRARYATRILAPR